MNENIRFLLNRLKERLWVRPLIVCLLSIAATFIAKGLDLPVWHWAPDISTKSINSLLSTLSASMLVIATFAVGSMVSAYASVSTTATPRAFTLVVSDDVSQNALSTFIGTFIFSIVALIALENGFYDQTGRFVLFVLTLLVFAIVILTFVHWIDRIARMGRVGNTVDVVESAARETLTRWHEAPFLGGHPETRVIDEKTQLFTTDIGYLQRIDMEQLQDCAKLMDIEVHLQVLPGTFCTPHKALAKIHATQTLDSDCMAQLKSAFVIGDTRTFDEDPRFGLITLSEIASRALSPAVNDPGTAIHVISSLVRLLAICSQPKADDEIEIRYDRVFVPRIVFHDLFDDAFTGIGRCGADSVEVAVRLQKGLHALSQMGNTELQAAANQHARVALQRSQQEMSMEYDLAQVRSAASFSQ